MNSPQGPRRGRLRRRPCIRRSMRVPASACRGCAAGASRSPASFWTTRRSAATMPVHDGSFRTAVRPSPEGIAFPIASYDRRLRLAAEGIERQIADQAIADWRMALRDAAGRLNSEGTQMPRNAPAEPELHLPLATFDDALGRRIIDTHIWAVREGLRGADGLRSVRRLLPAPGDRRDAAVARACRDGDACIRNGTAMATPGGATSTPSSPSIMTA